MTSSHVRGEPIILSTHTHTHTDLRSIWHVAMLVVVWMACTRCSFETSIVFSRCSSSRSSCRRNGDENWKCKHIADQWQHQYYRYSRWGSKRSSTDLISYSILTNHSHWTCQLSHLLIGDVFLLVISASLLNIQRDTKAKWMPSCTASLVLILSLSLSLEFLFILLPIVIEFFISLSLFLDTRFHFLLYLCAEEQSWEINEEQKYSNETQTNSSSRRKTTPRARSSPPSFSSDSLHEIEFTSALRDVMSTTRSRASEERVLSQDCLGMKSDLWQ